jgi:hypothetical protein
MVVVVGGGSGGGRFVVVQTIFGQRPSGGLEVRAALGRIQPPNAPGKLATVTSQGLSASTV